MAHDSEDAVSVVRLGRREAIKKAAVSGAAAGIIWSAPRVEGLTLRPNYAAAGTGAGTSSVTVDFTLPVPSAEAFDAMLDLPVTGPAGAGFTARVKGTVGIVSEAIDPPVLVAILAIGGDPAGGVDAVTSTFCTPPMAPDFCSLIPLDGSSGSGVTSRRAILELSWLPDEPAPSGKVTFLCS